MQVASMARAPVRQERLLGNRLRTLAQAAEALRQHLAAWPGRGLAGALAAHQAAACSLRFERLVGAGLRAGPSERDEAAFRREVAAVSECTERTWAAVRDALRVVASAPIESDAVVLDFVVECRGLQVQEAGVAAALAGGQDAWSAQDGAALDRLRQVQQVRAAGAGAQAAAYLLLDGRASLAWQLRKLADGLRGGLLERLRALVMHNVSTPAGELAAAQMARAELEAALAETRAHLARVEAGQQQLLHSLDALRAALAEAAVDAAAA